MAQVILTLLGLFLLWVFITVVGHASWMALRYLFSEPETLKSDRAADAASDAETAKRVLHRVENAGLMPPQAIEIICGNIDQLTKTSAADRRRTSPSIDQVAAEQLVETPRTPKEPVPSNAPRSSGPITPRHPQPILAAQDDSSATAEAVLETPAAQAPALSKAEIIRSFLAAHNVRWGELVAGMLIVICSVGLVLSLWNTIVATHPAIPSLIFAAANTAIFAAGLYTLSRWKLRHTSRAMLLIATLLVPLGILAGLATAGTDATAVALNDPITIGSIVLGGVVYLTLLWFGGRGLVGNRDSGPMILGVAGPAMMLPLVPAAIRHSDQAPILLLVTGAVSLLAALAWQLRVSFRAKCPTPGLSATRRRLVVLIVSSFSMAALTVNLLYLWGTTTEHLLAAAIAWIPAWVGIAEIARSICNWNQRPRLATTGTVISWIAVGCIGVTMPPALRSSTWLWCWAAVASGSFLIAAIGFRRSQWLALATAPLGWTAVLASQTFFGTHTWDSLMFWERIIGGQPMVAAFVIGLLVLVIAWAYPRFVDRKTDQDAPSFPLHSENLLAIIAAAFLGLGAVNVVVLSIAPGTWLGVVPAAVVTGLAAAAAIACATAPLFLLRSTIEPKTIVSDALAFIAIPLIAMGWCSALHPIAIGQAFASTQVWLITSLAIAATLVVMIEWLRRWHSSRAIMIWEIGVAVFTAAGFVFGLAILRQGWIAGAWSMLAVVVLLGWIALLKRSPGWLLATQSVTVVFAGVVGWGKFGDTLYSESAWRSSLAVWGWSTLLTLVVLAWILLRLASRQARLTRLRKTRVAWLSHRVVSPQRMLDTPLGGSAIVLLVIAVGHGFLSLLNGFLQSGSESIGLRFHSPVFAPLITLACIGGTTFIAKHLLGKLAGPVASITAVCAVIWMSCQIAARTMVDPTQQLVTATSFAALGCFAIWVGLSRASTRERLEGVGATIAARISAVTSLALMLVTSCLLWSHDWLLPVLSGETPVVFSTWTLAIWSALASLAAGWLAYKFQNAPALVASAATTVASTLLLMPLALPGASAVVVFAWLQWSIVALFAWTVVAFTVFRTQNFAEHVWRSIFDVAIASGTLVAIAVLLGVWLDLDFMSVMSGPASYALAVVTATAMLFRDRYTIPGKVDGAPLGRVAWPAVLTLFSGHLSMLIHTGIVEQWLGGWSSSLVSTPLRILMVLWLASSTLSLIRVFLRGTGAQACSRWEIRHAAVMAALVTVTSMSHSVTGFFGWTGLLGTVICGVLLIPLARTVVSGGKSPDNGIAGNVESILGRLLCWFLVGTGGYILINMCGRLNASDWLIWTAMMSWVSGWVFLWRFACPDLPSGSESDSARVGIRMLADSEFAVILLIAWCGELIVSIGATSGPGFIGQLDERWLALRLAIGTLVAASVIPRKNRAASWCTSVAIAVIATTVFAARIAHVYDATMTQAVTICVLVAACVVVSFAFVADMLASVIASASALWSQFSTSDFKRNDTQSPTRGSDAPWVAIDAIAWVAWGFAVVAIVTCCRYLMVDNTEKLLPLMIGGVAILGVAFAEIASQSRLNRRASRRTAAIAMGFIATFLWASVGVISTEYPLLTLTMRWFVASVCTLAMLAFALPKMLGESVAQQWSAAFARGRNVAAGVGTVTLLALFVQEAMIRMDGDPTLIEKPLILGVAATLALLSILTTIAAILSGPGMGYQQTWNLSDTTRRQLVIFAQVFGGLTWFHLFLCKSPLADLGLRAYWPYVVMTLAFVSVGITQWAKRRGDELMAQTLRQTSLYLPLVPVLGFWLSLSLFAVPGEPTAAQHAWSYVQGRVSYQSLLLVGTLYYAGLSFLWKNAFSRVSTVILGNLALWILLLQLPGWSFLRHPQAWLIPPAICVLIVTHLYREKLPATTASAIRYVAMLVIYISSTADMLLNDIGSTLAGPIVLVLLALAGMLAGVVLRVRPFLYLGAVFVFFGVTSMVWHAQTRIDEVWPWWAFGITTGLLLLAGLMAIEKNKPKLQRLASSLSTWEP